ncbi:Fibrinogen C domain-containing protein 1 [Holothuria leucospilota]|uniref:Fibrinogen C domain-containing protein 1 n=1 Tax=Holothuria leucospilota TaxID=206669 RepID=A0A9Q1BVR7_HOLLE|nr:Fibrinogen C domain-containing protein 1 [Holothuria leucospilota]
MGATFQSIQQITALVVFLICIDCVVTQSNGGSSEKFAASESYFNFFYQQPDFPKDCKDALNQCAESNSSGVHLIKPVGCKDAFEAYCKNEEGLDVWTVIQRRLEGSISFNRNWADFKNGFGFLSGEFWIGNDKLSYLTNQGLYELRVDMELSNGSSFYVSYNSFRISDEWSQYAIVSLGSNDHADDPVTYCPLNMIYGMCTCQPSCSNPNDTNSCISSCEETEICICAEGFLQKGGECVPPNECGCYVAEINQVIPNGESYVNNDCTVNYTCHNDRLNSDSSYTCNRNAQCIVKEGVRQCYCNEGYKGDGETCSPSYTDCYDAYQAGHTEDGVYTILPSGWPGSPFNVSCVMSTNGGGWTVFQRRTDGVTDFYRNWASYRYGFGSFDGDFWLGNEQLHYLTIQKNYKLRVEFVTSGGTPKYASYESFRVSSNDNKYRVDHIGSYSGTAVNGMLATSGRAFSTYDQDNDECGNHNCAQGHRGAWWYANDWCSHCKRSNCDNFRDSGSCSGECTYSNLNGDYNGGNGEVMFWDDEYYCSPTFTEMKIRPS